MQETEYQYNAKNNFDYALAVDVNGRSYEAWPLINSFAAMDKEEDNRQLYSV
ncbi:hypothetical protein [Paenibacillus sp. RU5M]|uniref:hypothetical protein n=1 Tax=Paenibacillus sp. RU5M TaxID=1907396 RepID=UPI0015CCC711|nr:hypothetical protein [Paenibacillus sp. RU5M]